MQLLDILLTKAQETVGLLPPAHQPAANRVLQMCRDRSVSGETLLDLLDNASDGIALYEESAENETERAVWNCIIDAAGFAARLAYEAEGTPALPEPLESADESIIPHFEACYRKCIRKGE